ncbi:MAG: hypothetical protein IH988_06540 [Planctomycetes bacterium]|nr:hypothetical protein [Planctomycetota bacterium]
MCSSLPIRLGSLITGSLAALFGATAATAQIPCGYEVTAVIQGPWCGEIFGYPPTRGRGVTEDGAVVGYYTSCDIGPGEAFYWSESTGFVTLSRPPGYTSATARDIDGQTGWIIGALSTPGTDGPFAALWPAWSAEPIDLGTLPGGDYSQAFAVSAGRVVGKWGNEIMGPGIQAFLWQDNQMIDLGPDLGTPSGWAWDVNDAGQVCGWMGTATSLDARAFIWDAGRVTELPAIPGGFTSEGLAISADGGTVVGVGRIIDDKTGDDFSRAFVWQDGKMVNLGTLPGLLRSGATDVNDNSLVIGPLWGGVPDTGFIWHDGVMIDLNTLIPPESGVEVTIPWAINEQGMIAAQGHNQDGDVVALLLTPVEAAVADLDGDCHVGIIDLLILLSEWGQADSSADLNDDGIVNVFDLLIVLANWG